MCGLSVAHRPRSAQHTGVLMYNTTHISIRRARRASRSASPAPATAATLRMLAERDSRDVPAGPHARRDRRRPGAPRRRPGLGRASRIVGPVHPLGRARSPCSTRPRRASFARPRAAAASAAAPRSRPTGARVSALRLRPHLRWPAWRRRSRDSDATLTADVWRRLRVRRAISGGQGSSSCFGIASPPGWLGLFDPREGRSSADAAAASS